MHRSKTRKLFDYLVGAHQERLGHVQTNHLGGLEIDDKLEFGWLLNRQIRWFGALQNLVRVASPTPEQVRQAGAVRQQPTSQYDFSCREHPWQTIFGEEIDDCHDAELME